MAADHICFASDGLTLEGILDRPERLSPAPGIVICHPHPLYGGDMDNNVVMALADALAGAGYATLRFNFRGVGRSTGRYGEGLGERQDVAGALTWMATQTGVDAQRLLLAGYSFGARVALAVAAIDPRVSGFIAVAPSVRQGPWPSLESSRGPKIFVCGEVDSHAPPEALSPWVELVPPPKRLLVLPDADHFFLGHEHSLGQQVVKLLQECR